MPQCHVNGGAPLGGTSVPSVVVIGCSSCYRWPQPTSTTAGGYAQLQQTLLWLPAEPHTVVRVHCDTQQHVGLRSSMSWPIGCGIYCARPNPGDICPRFKAKTESHVGSMVVSAVRLQSYSNLRQSPGSSLRASHVADSLHSPHFLEEHTRSAQLLPGMDGTIRAITLRMFMQSVAMQLGHAAPARPHATYARGRLAALAALPRGTHSQCTAAAGNGWNNQSNYSADVHAISCHATRPCRSSKAPCYLCTWQHTVPVSTCSQHLELHSAV
jgi:hypothetical protein